MIDSQKIGQFILEKRKSFGYTQQQLAEVLGVTNKAVSKWETGEGLPDISLFPVLGEVLGVSVDELLQGGALAHSSEDNQGRKTSVTDGVALSRYQWERQIEKFKKRCLVSLFISLLGTICFGIVWLEQQDYYSFGIGIIAQLVSICLFVASYWSLAFEERAYLALYSEEKPQSRALFWKFLCWLLMFWLIVPLLLLDNFVVRLIPWARSSIADISFFLAGIGIIALFLLFNHYRRRW